MSADINLDKELARLFSEDGGKGEIESLCKRYGASFVIDTARAWVAAKEKAASEEHARWRAAMIAADKAAGVRP